MKPFIWDYEDALVNRDAAVTWILCCKKGLMHKDTAKKIASYVFSGFEYANGTLRFLSANGGKRIISWENGIPNQKLFIHKGDILYIIGCLLDCIYDEKKSFCFYQGKWDFNGKEPTKRQHLKILEHVCEFAFPEPLYVRWIQNDIEDIVSCDTIGDVVVFIKNHQGDNFFRHFNKYERQNIVYTIPDDGPVTIYHRYKFI